MVKSKKEKPYCIGCAIIVPGIARFVVSGDQASYRMYHYNGNSVCDHRDVSGFCSGHEMARKDFLKKYCDGIVPKRLFDE
jgi:hypothetical protein